MLTVRIQRFAAAITMALLATTVPVTAAFAGQTGSCTDSGDTVGCTAGVGGSGGSVTPTPTPNGGSSSGSTNNAPTCGWELLSTFDAALGAAAGPAPAGDNPNGAWYYDTCIGDLTIGAGVSWFGTVPTTSPPPPPPDPTVAAAQAGSEIPVPSPTLTFSPSTNGWVNFAEWLWIGGILWQPVSTTATACNAGGCTRVTATATPQYVTWDTGDGTPPTVCDGPGTAYNLSEPFADQSTKCSHTFTTTSTGFPVTATVTWSVAWSGPDGSSGQLANINTQGSSTLKVEQIESVNGAS